MMTLTRRAHEKLENQCIEFSRNGFANRAYGKLKPFLDGPLSRIAILASCIMIAILKDFGTTDGIMNLDPIL